MEAFLLAQLWREAGVAAPRPLKAGVGGALTTPGGSLLPVERLSAAFSQADDASRTWLRLGFLVTLTYPNPGP